MAAYLSEYSRMSKSAWISSTGRALRGKTEAQVLYAYLVYNTHANMFGLYYLPKTFISYELGQTTKFIDNGLKELAKVGFAYYDNKTEYVFVVEMAHWQVGEMHGGDRRITTANKYYASLMTNPFLGMFYNRYQDELSLTTPLRVHDCHIDTCPCRFDKIRYDSIRSSVTDTATDFFSSSLEEKELKTKEILKTKEEELQIVVEERKFSDDPQNLVDLWNKHAPVKLPRKRKPNETVVKLINSAYKQLPNREDWEEIMSEYHLSAYLRNEVSDYATPNFEWLLDKHKSGVENYILVQGQKYRDKNTNGYNNLMQKNLAAAAKSMEKFDQPTENNLVLTGRIDDGYEVDSNYHSTSSHVSGHSWTDTDDSANQCLSRRPDEFSRE